MPDIKGDSSKAYLAIDLVPGGFKTRPASTAGISASHAMDALLEEMPYQVDTARALISIAISQKRQAIALEKCADALTDFTRYVGNNPFVVRVE